MGVVMCMLCSIDVNAVSLVVPIAQATVISAPILLRGHIRRGATRALAWRRGHAARAGHTATEEDESESIESVQPDA